MDVVFTSERLIFRKFAEDDGPLIYQLNSDPEVLKYLHEEPTTLQKAADVVKNVILPSIQIIQPWQVAGSFENH